MRWLVALLLLASAPLLAQTRGYVARANGFDLDQNGTVGEVGVDDLICDEVGGSDVSNRYSEDLFFDGTAEEQIFVDCSGGTDNATCGLPGTPCLTLNYALNTRATTDDGQADVICFKNTCTPENLVLGGGGIAGSYVRVKSGNEVRDTRLPTEPLVLAGWDADGDNSYPPFDTDDTSVLEGTGLTRVLDVGNTDYFEIAHFDVQNYSDSSFNSDTFGNFQASQYQNLHDMEWVNIADRAGDVRWIYIGDTHEHMVLENNYVEHGGVFIIRGFYDATGVYGPVLVKNLTAVGDDVSGDSWAFWDVSGYLTGADFVDSVIDVDAKTWDPALTQHIGFQFNNCTQDLNVVNSYIAGFSTHFQIKGGSTSFCNGGGPGRLTCDDCLIDRNEIVFDTNYGSLKGKAFGLDDAGFDESKMVVDVIITNNIIYNVLPAKMMMFINDERRDDDTAFPGTLTAVNNTVISTDSLNPTTRSFIWLEADGAGIRPQNYVLKNNIFNFGSDSGRRQINTEWAPSGWDSDNNVWDATASYIWNGGSVRTTLADWQSDTGGDDNSAECDPTFVGGLESAADLHLAANDLCALDNGATLLTVTDSDYDGPDNRPVNNWDIGADEVEEGEDPPAPDPGDGIVLSGSGVDGSNTQ